ncbi:hypothetical protein DID78_00160 [Candidatus Marinamargulisbacteria bacterium SCGC AG-343-D04]|nr:hypothetical protein DID78_00160 [Candidatus Marinamargulisbacteria bacterium SCGC AG-343-D04]
MIKNKDLIANFKDSTLIIVVTYRRKNIIQLSIENILNIINKRKNTYMVIINNHSSEEVNTYVRSIDHPQCVNIQLPFNFGKALAANFFFKDYISHKNLPKTIISLDPDTVFSKESFEKLVSASINLPQCGMIGMRYTKNNCNPERNLFFKPKKIKSNSNNIYSLSCPFMCTVAGPIFAVEGKKILNECNNELFPKKVIKVYGGDDSALYNKLRKKYINGYLEGTEATHMHSGNKTCIPKELDQ